MISLHNHTNYCDGKNTVYEMLQSAVHSGISHFGLSGHSPILKDNEWSMKNMAVASEYISDIEKYSGAFPNIKIYKGIEADFIPGLSHSFDFLRKELRLHYIIGSVHLVKTNSGIWFIDGPVEGYDRGLEKHFNGDIINGLKQYYHQQMLMIEKENFEILGHCDKVLMHNNGRYIQNNDPIHIALLKETLMLAKGKNIVVEINTRGLYKGLHSDFYPGTYIFPFIKKEKIPIIFSADGHDVEQIVKGYSEWDAAIDEYDLRSLVITPEEIEERFM